MSTKTAVICCICALTIGGAVGRFSLPAKVVVRTQTVEVERKVSVIDTAQQDNSVTTVTRTQKPDGTVTLVTETRNNVKTATVAKSKDDDTKQSESSTTTTYDKGKLTISALMITDALAGPKTPAAYALDVSYRFVGPFSVNVLGATNGLLGVGVGISF